MLILHRTITLGFAAALAATVEARAQPEAPEATSLMGKPLYRLQIPSDQKAKLDENLAKAQADYDKDPKNADNVIWLGRRLAYLHRYRDAIGVFSKGAALYPEDARFYRHRGHRYITLRDLDKSLADFEKAASLIKGKPDQEEASGTGGRPGTLHFNVWYHKGLAHYLKGDFEKAREAYVECMKVSEGDNESVVATSDWLYMTLRRVGKKDDAAKILERITADMEIKENVAYHKRLLLYKGLAKPESLLTLEKPDELQLATQGYGVANWYLYNGDTTKARELFTKVVAGTYWPAFGYIAAEVDLKRMPAN